MNLLKMSFGSENWVEGTEGEVSVQDVGRDVYC